ncbi:MAG: radical SAM protein [Candidatus Altiarchaeota archaeon]
MASSNTCFKADNETDLTATFLKNPPKKLLLTLSQNCNLACKHCFRQLKPGLKGEMSTELLDKLLTEVFPHLEYVRVGGADLGEPMTYSFFDYMMQKARGSGPFIELQSNGVLIDEGNVDSIVSCCDRVCLSAEGSGESYERVRGVSYGRFREAVRLLVEARGRINPGMRIEFVVAALMYSYPSLDALFRVPGVDAVNLRYLEPVYASDYANSPFSRMDESDKWIDYYTALAEELDVFFSHPGKFGEGNPNERIQCPLPWESVHVDFDGTVYSCCEDLYMGRLGLNDELTSVWNNKAYQRLRETVNSQKPPIACRNCYATTHPKKRAENIKKKLYYTSILRQTDKLAYRLGGWGLSSKLKRMYSSYLSR